MQDWVAQLREQAARIAAGDYRPSADAFRDAPAGMAELSLELDGLAQLMAARETVRKAHAREVHHRVKNNLQIVTSLLNLQASRIENPAAREALGQTRARIGAIALIHRILYDKADDGSQATLDIAELLGELSMQFRTWNRSRTEIAFSWEAASLAVPLDGALPLVLFAVEAVTNAYAYAFPGGRSGTVRLNFGLTEDGRAQLGVTDNGIGFDSSSNIGSMGRQLMQGFAHQLGGRIEIDSSPETGTEVRLDFRIKAPVAPA